METRLDAKYHQSTRRVPERDLETHLGQGTLERASTSADKTLHSQRSLPRSLKNEATEPTAPPGACLESNVWLNVMAGVKPAIVFDTPVARPRNSRVYAFVATGWLT
jgi:hypothetical protein